MAKRKFIVAVIAIVLGTLTLAALSIFLFKSNSVPDELKTIPGFLRATKVSQNNFDVVYDVVIKDKAEITCRLNLKIDAHGNIIFPQKDEVFSVIITKQGLNLFDQSGNRGVLPGIFITKVDQSEYWSVTEPGKDPMPVSIEPGKINNLDLSQDTVITGPKGLPVTIFSKGVEIASGRLPLRLNLDKQKAIATVDKAFVSHMLSSGLMHIYIGSQSVYNGKNTIRPAAQAVGNSIWFTQGMFVSFDGKTSFVEQNERLFFKIGQKEQSIEVKAINPSMGAFEHNGLIYWVDIQGYINKTEINGKSIKTNAKTDKPIFQSDKFIISDTKAYTMSFEPVNPMQNWIWTAKGWFLKKDGDHIFASGKTSWTVKSSIPKEALLKIHSGSMAYFELDGKVSSLFDLETGQIENQEMLQLQTNGDLTFPDGVFVKNSVQHSSDKSFWSRKGWKLEKFGAFGVFCQNEKTGEKELINHDNGLKALFWSDSDCKVIFLDRENLVFEIGKTIFTVKRIITPN
jgi:hypothetical protein